MNFFRTNDSARHKYVSAHDGIQEKENASEKKTREYTKKFGKTKKLRKKLRGFLTKQEQTLYQNTVPQPIS